MSVVVFAETWEGRFKKATFEAVGYASALGREMGTETVAVVLGQCSDELEQLGRYGAAKVVHIAGADLNSFEASRYAAALSAQVERAGANVLIVSGSFNGKTLAPLVSVALEAALITQCVELPTSTQPVRVKRGAFSGKGYAYFESRAPKHVLSIVPNGIGLKEHPVSAVVETAEMAVAAPKTQQISVERASGTIALPEAEIVVSGGRGLKAPENWKMLEELAEVLGAGTACSKPVSDMHWRPHSEHVGQTGIAINPNLYIAVGISGAIQHLAGVSGSKTIVVINSDPEAPFFKAADYGIVGDAFEVVPKLTAAVKAFKSAH
ncbi:electron transfer flavoprotein subunit alpha/FixB family protein [bacterium]|nr:electron transfer flavoprotein subunit alpha/FixB family protein [bacterium]